jgi:hypothetical protein
VTLFLKSLPEIAGLDPNTIMKRNQLNWMRTALALGLAGVMLPASAAIIEVTTPLPRGKVEWTRDNVYVLKGLVHALSGTQLHIEAGTVIKGEDLGTAALERGGLVICRGAQIFAEGTPTQPIIMTATIDDVDDPFDLDIYDRGLWGGLVVLGRAVLNGAADTTGNVASPVYDVYEGLPDHVIEGEFVHRFGGTDDDDNSGVIRYVSIRHGGARIEQNKEINGLTLGAVGRGTTIEFVEAYAIADDGFEFFGGTVNTRYLVSAFCDDDNFDADQGYSGLNQFWFVLQADDAQNYGMELNGEVSGTTGDHPRQPFSTFQAYNVTLIGAGVHNAPVGEDNDAFRIREFSTPRIHNGIFTDYSRRGVRIDDKSGQFLEDGTLQLTHNLWWGFRGEDGQPNNSVEWIAVDPRAQVLFTDPARRNLIADPLLRGISRDADGGLDPRPAPGSPALNPENVKPLPQDPFYRPAAYLGAFGDYNWMVDWTALSAYGVMSAGGGRNPVLLPPSGAQAPIVAAQLDGNELVLSWTGNSASYLVQRKPNLEQAGWDTVTTTPLTTVRVPVEGATGFYQVISQ